MTKQLLRTSVLGMLIGLTARAATADSTFRLDGFETSSLPTVYTILDVRPEAAQSQALNASDFQLLEDGKGTALATRILKFRDTDAGLALIVAIDVSPSMQGRPIAAIRKGLVQLISRKRDSDRITVLTFADDIRWETRWNASSSAMRQAFESLQTRGNATRLYDTVGEAMDEIAAQSQQDSTFPARAGILVFSDGHDEGSHTTLNRVAARLRTSRVRLDTVGLAHTPIWLRSLQILANAGFGGFRTASTPEQLTQMLGQGIDTLLDMPAIEFNAENVTGDGKAHPLGIEYLPTHWRDQMAVTVPKWPIYRNAGFWIAAGVAVLLLIACLIYFVRRRGRPVASQRPSVVASAPPSPPAPPRIGTQLETTGSAHPVAAVPRIPTVIEHKLQSMANAVPVSVVGDPQPTPRTATMLASQYSQETGPRTLVTASGPYAGQRFPISQEEFWIGSAANNHLSLSADPAVSGNHACIRHEGLFNRLYDNGSLNNTYVNGRPIGREVVLLRSGDQIRVGQSEFIVEL